MNKKIYCTIFHFACLQRQQKRKKANRKVKGKHSEQLLKTPIQAAIGQNNCEKKLLKRLKKMF